METFSAKWFLLYYIVLGFLLVGSGFWLIIKKKRGETFLAKAATRQKPPRIFISILKYFLLFTLPGLLFSLIYFSWIELFFSLWSLLLVYLGGIRLVRWRQTKALIESKEEKLAEITSGFGAVMVSVGFVMFLLAFLVIQKASF